MQERQASVGSFEQGRFGDFERELARRQPGIVERPPYYIHQIAALELGGREIDRNLDVARPTGGFLAGRVENPFAESIDKAGFLGKFDKTIGRHHAQTWMAPS